jgi:hypothetical protein
LHKDRIRKDPDGREVINKMNKVVLTSSGARMKRRGNKMRRQR